MRSPQISHESHFNGYNRIIRIQKKRHFCELTFCANFWHIPLSGLQLRSMIFVGHYSDRQSTVVSATFRYWLPRLDLAAMGTTKINETHSTKWVDWERKARVVNSPPAHIKITRSDFFLYKPLDWWVLMPYSSGDDYSTMSFSFGRRFRVCVAIDSVCLLQVRNEYEWWKCNHDAKHDFIIDNFFFLPRILLNFAPGLCGVTLMIGTMLLFIWWLCVWWLFWVGNWCVCRCDNAGDAFDFVDLLTFESGDDFVSTTSLLGPVPIPSCAFVLLFR